MANEIRQSTSLQIVRNGLTITGTNTATISMTGSNYKGEVIDIGTSYEQLPTGSCGDVRCIFIKNVSTSSIDIAANSASQSFCTLRYGDAMSMPPASALATLWVKAASAGATIQYIFVES